MWQLLGRQWCRVGTDKEILADYQAQSTGIGKWAPKEFAFNEFMESLAYIQVMSLCPRCKEGGGDPVCKVRVCASKRKLTNCSQCDELAECRNFEELEKGYPKIKEELAKIKNADQKEVIEKWTDELKTRWPHCVLLCEATKR